MNGFLRAIAIGFAGLCALAVLGVEIVSQLKGAAYREPLYLGCAAGLLVNAAGFPFVARMNALPAEVIKGGGYWPWWIGGFLLRLGMLGLASYWLNGRYGTRDGAMLLALMLVYMAGLGAELIWIGRRFNAMDAK